MATTRIQRSFAFGEVAPALAARADKALYPQALKTCRNFLIQRHGGATNRAGLKYLAEVKTSSVRTYLFKFVLNTTQSYLIEAGANYFRFLKNGVPVLSGGVPYEVTTPYSTADLADLQATQSGAVLTLTHPSYAPRELTRTGDTSWTLTTVTTAPATATPTSVGVVAGAAGARTYRYQVTARGTDPADESLPSSTVTLVAAGVPSETAPHVVTWAAVTGAAEYHVYGDPAGNGIFGFLGSAATPAFNDVGFDPSYGLTPPQARSLFASASTYPRVAGYYQQRRWFANSTNEPQLIWASHIAAHKNFCISSPIQDDDALTFRLVGPDVQTVVHFVPLKTLLVFTDTGAWTLKGDAGALAPTAINPDQVSFHGAAPVRPVVLGNTVIYAQARGRILRDLRFDFAVDSFGGRDLTLFASHLFDGYTVTRLAYAETPHSIVWAIRSDGALLGLTYLPEEEAWAWHRHDTGASGVFEDLVVNAENNEDVVYVVVKRTVLGVTRRYIERLASRLVTTVSSDAFFVDAGITYSGAAATTITGLSHLNGETVAILADGHVVAQQMVSGGAITLAQAASVVHVGLPITADLELLDLDVFGNDVRDRRKAIHSVGILVAESRGLWVGSDATTLRELQAAPLPTYDTAPGVTTGRVEVTLAGTWTDHGRVFLRQSDPLPLTVLGVLPSGTVGG